MTKHNLVVLLMDIVKRLSSLEERVKAVNASGLRRRGVRAAIRQAALDIRKASAILDEAISFVGEETHDRRSLESGRKRERGN